VASISPTVGFNIKSLEYRGYTLNVWDVGGQQTIRAYWRNYFEQTDGVIWVVDSVDRWRLEDCRRELFALLSQEVSSNCGWRCVADEPDAWFIVVMGRNSLAHRC
jgi:ADP-ribosylation factor-like protein 2